MPVEGAGIEAPVLEELETEQIDDQLGDGGDGGGDGDGQGDGGDGDGGAQGSGGQGEQRQDERKLPQWIKDLKGVNQAAFKEAKGQFFGKLAIDDKLKDFDIDGVKGFLEEHGGREALGTMLEELTTAQTELTKIQQAVAAGDRSIIESMATDSPDGFSKLAPAVAEKWAQVDPEGWDHAMSGVFNATIQQSGVPMHLERMTLQMDQMKFALEQNPQLVQQSPALAAAYNALTGQLQTLKGWMGSFAEKAGKPLQRQQQQQQGAGKGDQRAQELDQREQAMFDQDLNRDVKNFRDPLISKELASFIARDPKDEEKKQLAIDTVRAKVIEKMSADTKFQKDLIALQRKKDKAGAMRLISSRETTAIQEIAPKVGRTIFGSAAAKKQDASQQNNGGRQQQQQQRRQTQPEVDPRKAVLLRAFNR